MTKNSRTHWNTLYYLPMALLLVLMLAVGLEQSTLLQVPRLEIAAEVGAWLEKSVQDLDTELTDSAVMQLLTGQKTVAWKGNPAVFIIEEGHAIYWSDAGLDYKPFLSGHPGDNPADTIFLAQQEKWRAVWVQKKRNISGHNLQVIACWNVQAFLDRTFRRCLQAPVEECTALTAAGCIPLPVSCFRNEVFYLLTVLKLVGLGSCLWLIHLIGMRTVRAKGLIPGLLLFGVPAAGVVFGLMPLFFGPQRMVVQLSVLAFAFLWISYYFFRISGRQVRLEKLPLGKPFVISTAVFLVMFFILALVVEWLKYLVWSSGVDFSATGILSFDQDHLLATVALLAVLAGLFFVSLRGLQWLVAFQQKQIRKILSMLLALAVLSGILVVFYREFPVVEFIFISFLYFAVFDFFVEKEASNFTWIIYQLALFAFLPAFWLFHHQSTYTREQRIEAVKALPPMQTDDLDNWALASASLSGNDSLLQLLTIPAPYRVEKELVHQIIRPVLATYFPAYPEFTFNAFAFQPSTNHVLLEGQDWREILEIQTYLRLGAEPVSQGLWVNGNEDKYYAWINLPLPGNEEESHALIVEFSPQNNQLPTLENPAGRSFSIWLDGHLIKKQGTPIQWQPQWKDLPIGYPVEMTAGNQTLVVYRPHNAQVSVVAQPQSTTIENLNYFSFLFFLITIGVWMLIMLAHRVQWIFSFFPFLAKPSLKFNIQFWGILFILCICLIVGWITIYFFQQNNEQSRFLTLEKNILDNQEQFFTNYASIPANAQDLQRFLRKLKFQSQPVYIYDHAGALVAGEADAPAPPLMPFEIYHSMNRKSPGAPSLRLHDDKNGGTVAYGILSGIDAQQPIAGFLAVQAVKNQAIAQFIGPTLNLYLCLFVVATVLTLLITNRVTAPLEQLSEKLKHVTIDANEPLEWKRQDEIGTLVTEYNNMIRKLEDSAEKLKRSEREGAWREMAKQVAHEIKNPLTPMKLSIQHLLRAFKTRPEEIETHITKVSQTLIEQIDGLTTIANEFSNFAKMPTPVNETFNLRDLVQSAFGLFQEYNAQEIDFQLDIPQEEILVNADKNQLLRVMNNLLQNAIQAIPSTQPGKILVSLARQKSLAIVKVQDNGTGIPEALRDKVFFPNFTTKSSGSGLGLAMCKNIVEAAKGQIYFETEEGMGTSFVVEVPMEGGG